MFGAGKVEVTGRDGATAGVLLAAGVDGVMVAVSVSVTWTESGTMLCTLSESGTTGTLGLS